MRTLLIGTVVGSVNRTWLRRLLAPLGKAKLNETDLLVSLAEAMRLQGVMIDVGARYGTSLAPFLRRGWQVFAFEPDPANRRVLRWLRPWLPAFEVDARACSDEPAEGVTFFVNSGHSAVSSLLPFDAGHQPGQTVDVTTLDLALSEHGVESVEVLKIDAEGYDLHVLRGLDLQGPLRPKLIMCEFDGGKVANGGHEFRELVSVMTDAGYRVIVSEWYPIDKYGGSHKWRALEWYPHELADPLSHGNVIAIARDVPAEVVEPVLADWSGAMARGGE